MTAKLISNNYKLKITSYPFRVLMIPIIFILIFWGAIAFNPENRTQFKLFEYFLIHFICFTIPAILQYKILVFDKQDKSVVFMKRNLFIHKTQKFSIKDISDVNMIYGRGIGNAKGGSISLIVKGVSIQVVDSDIGKKNLKRNKAIVFEIKNFLKDCV